MPQSKRHRDEPDIPSDLTERKQWVDDLYAHRIWEYGEPLTSDGKWAAEILGREPKPHTFYMSDAHGLISIRPAYVNPENRCIEYDASKNTHFEVWIEAGPMHDNSTDGHTPEPEGGWNWGNRWVGSHDIRLDCGGDTLEEALLILYARIQTFYNEDGTSTDKWWCSWHDTEAECQGEVGDYCPECGFLIEPGDNLYEVIRERLKE